MKKGFIISLAIALIFLSLNCGWCKTDDTQQKELSQTQTVQTENTIYTNMITGNVDDMKSFLTEETAVKVNVSANANVLGNLDQIFGIAQGIKDNRYTGKISDIKFNFKEVKPSKVVVVTNCAIMLKENPEMSGKSKPEYINDTGTHEIILLKESDIWRIMNLTDITE
jgi:hypothetical protein